MLQMLWVAHEFADEPAVQVEIAELGLCIGGRHADEGQQTKRAHHGQAACHDHSPGSGNKIDCAHNGFLESFVPETRGSRLLVTAGTFWRKTAHRSGKATIEL
jgi:hypothetical protein